MKKVKCNLHQTNCIGLAFVTYKCVSVNKCANNKVSKKFCISNPGSQFKRERMKSEIQNNKSSIKSLRGKKKKTSKIQLSKIFLVPMIPALEK